jgi:hypothetical protein
VPVSVKIDPFSGQPIRRTDLRLLTPQARVLEALKPRREDDPPDEWPLATRAQLGVRAGYTALSGTVTRAINGVRPGSSSGDPHPGLLARGMIEEVVLDIEGLLETNYRITPLGLLAYRAHLTSVGGKLPEPRDRAVSTNDRYKKPEQQQQEAAK